MLIGNFLHMYTQDFWDNIYLQHYQDAPWMDDSWKSGIIQTLEQDMNTHTSINYKGRRLLDYGCGNGHMGISFLKYGMKIDLTDISRVLVEKLNSEYANNERITIYQTKTPLDLPKRNKYVSIIAWNLFHHLQPEIWHQFLSEFADKMIVGGLLFVSGWDKEDTIIKEDQNQARFTQRDTWFINELANYVNNLPLELVKDVQLCVSVAAFYNPRVFRYFIFKKIRKSN